MICPRCLMEYTGATRCVECGVPLVARDDLRVRGEVGPDANFRVVAELLDPFEGPRIVEILESRRIPTILREGQLAGTHLMPYAPKWGEVLVPERELDEARALVQTLREELAGGDAFPELEPAPEPTLPIAPVDLRLEPYTGGGPPPVMPMHRMGRLEVTGRAGPGGALEGTLWTDNRLARHAEIELLERFEPGPSTTRALARVHLDLDIDHPGEIRDFRLELPPHAARPTPRGTAGPALELVCRVRGRRVTFYENRVRLHPAPQP